jgi:SOS-response transcriptional repressor LexA
VVALLEGEVTLKKILHQDGRTILKPRNPRHKPIALDPSALKILGVVIGTFRRH